MAYNQLGDDFYKKNSINTASPVKIVILLYEAAIKNLDSAEVNIGDFKTYDLTTRYINKSIDIVTELRVSLNFEKGKEIAENLDSLYDFILEKIKEANLKKDKKPLHEARKILVKLLDSWLALEKQNRKNLGGNPLKGFSISG